MSNNYACIHIRTTAIEQTSALVAETYDTTAGLEGINPLVRNEYLKIIENAKLLGNNLLNKVLRINNEVAILETSDMVSVYDKNISFETVAEKAKEISRKTKEPVLYLSCFGGDIFLFGVVLKGKICTKGVIGEDPQDYGIDACNADLNVIQKTFGIPCENLKEVLSDTDDVMDLIDKFQQEFEKHLRVPLNFRKDRIDSYDGEYRKKYESNGVEIFERC